MKRDEVIRILKEHHGDLLLHPVPDRRTQAARRAEIDLAAEQLPQVKLQANQAQISGGPAELHQQIDVAGVRRLVAGHRAEQGERPDAEALREGVQDILTAIAEIQGSWRG